MISLGRGAADPKAIADVCSSFVGNQGEKEPHKKGALPVAGVVWGASLTTVQYEPTCLVGASISISSASLGTAPPLLLTPNQKIKDGKSSLACLI